MSFVGSCTSPQMQSQNGKKGGKKTKESGKLKENLVKATAKAAQNKSYLKAMLRKTEIYLQRHKNNLDKTREKELFVSSIKREIKFLKKGIYTA